MLSAILGDGEASNGGEKRHSNGKASHQKVNSNDPKPGKENDFTGEGEPEELSDDSEVPRGRTTKETPQEDAQDSSGLLGYLGFGAGDTSPDPPPNLREQEDVGEIYRSISREGDETGNSSFGRTKSSGSRRQKSKVAFNSEDKIVGNSWSPFSWYNADKKEKRYSDSEDEDRDRNTEPEAGTPEDESPVEDDVADTPPPTGEDTEPVEGTTTKRHAFRPLFNRNPTGKRLNTSATVASANTALKQRFFGKNRSKKGNTNSRKQSVYCIEDDSDPDYFTSIRAQQLVGSLAAGAPAINILASCLLEDEHGIGRAPLLLSLLGIKVSDTSLRVNTKNRKFKIDLEYGVGQERLQWSVERTAKDLFYLHSKFKLDNWRSEVVRNKNTDLPKYPIPPSMQRKRKKRGTNTDVSEYGLVQSPVENERDGRLGTFPSNGAATDAHGSNEKSNATANGKSTANDNPDYGMSNADVDESEESRNPTYLSPNVATTNVSRSASGANRGNGDSAAVSDHESVISSHTMQHVRSHFSSISSFNEQSPEILRSKIHQNQEYINQVARYLNDLINSIALTPQSNRLFQFFEISPISSLLSYETGFQGKQGVIHVGGTTKAQGWRVGHFKANDLKEMIDRRSEKWLLIRNTYIMYVSDINSTLPLEVFLVDPKFAIRYKQQSLQQQHNREDEESDYDDSSLAAQKAYTSEKFTSHQPNVFKHLKITLENSERQLVLTPKSQKEQRLWIKSLEEMKNQTVWAEPHRFDSFAPVRDNCFAQWFVDGRDYFWAVSSALEMAKDVIFIHDWWLSPELYLRRPANGNQQWRIDRILQRKAQQGVKIFVIVYRNVGTTVATDSLYTKHSILSLNEENIHVIRSPNQLLQNTYFWAHHEKLCIVDQTVAFIGGIDLCYGRYDTPDHVLVDDSKQTFDTLSESARQTTEEHVKFQTFPGKDYSNPRVKDFFGLEKPYESMYDRQSIPRMPWHDVHMVTSGKIASDLARHFVQRWNYLLRQKRPSRFTPLLTPPPDFTDEEVADMGLGGTCEVQLLRSSGNWSLGLKEPEHSIQNAYLRLIETSEHLVYIENQFFVTSCVVDGTEIRNRIGDALVDRIIRAHQEGTPWRAIIVIPLMPGFESQVDEPEGSSVRVIMQCQYMSISRGATSIFAKLKRAGIEPDDYIQFFSLRKWGIIGPDRTLVTEQLYIHAKTMIVDDRAAIIGSANINERSMRGIRDSEMAAIVRDKETIQTTMAGEPYLAGKFAHTLRMRLMREHLGVNVDILDLIERRFKKVEIYAGTEAGIKAAPKKFAKREHTILSAMVELASRDILGQTEGTRNWKKHHGKVATDVQNEILAVLEECNEEEENDPSLKHPAPLSLPISFNNRTGTYEANKGIRDKKKHSYDARVQQSQEHKNDVAGHGPDKFKSKLARRARLNSAKFLRELAHKAMLENSTGIFLPPAEEVEEFLAGDDEDESEEVITERNKERWQLLKKISYMQRSAAKEKEQRDEEQKKRCEAGLGKFAEAGQQNGFVGTAAAAAAATSSPPVSSAAPSASNAPAAGVNNSSTPSGTSPTQHVEKFIDSEELSKVAPPIPDDDLDSSEQHDNIPIVSLSEQGVVDLMSTVNPKQYDNFSTFVDPYGFEDPLDDEFYEDLWFEHARRNTEIYRMIFHTQPDDYVSTWKDYKRFSKLQSAFLLAQKQEAKYRQSSRSPDDSIQREEEELRSEASSESPSRPSIYRQQSVKMDNFQDLGILGYAPGEAKMEVHKKKKGGRGRFGKDVIEETHKEYENEEQGADEEADDYSSASENVGDKETQSTPPTVNGGPTPPQFPNKNRRRRGGTFSARRKALTGDRIYDRETAERILTEIQGHLVFFPADWLMRELEGDNWFYNTDRIPPIEIYD
ncbi:phospholipase D1 [[Candida] anglica]|uniref:phospholipase D n=1 Tax=[Candida] anglica TaxID=148631 RepID=A0ABP0EE86_9ASCO